MIKTGFYKKDYYSLYFLAGIILFFVAGPIISLLLPAADEIAVSGVGGISSMIMGRRKSVLFLRTVIYSLETAFICTAVSVFACAVMWKARKGILGKLKWGFLFMLPLPPYIHALVWWKFFFYLNKVLFVVGIGEISTRGYGISLFTQVMAFLPIALAFSMISYETVERRLIDQGRILMGDKRIFLKIVLPLSFPVIMLGAGIIYILTFNDYSISSIFSENLYSLEIFVVFSSTNNPGLAMISALPGIVSIFLLLLIILKSIKRVHFIPEIKNRREVLPKTGRCFNLIGYFGVSIVFLQIFIPIIILMLNAADLIEVLYSIKTSVEETWNTFYISLLTSIFAVFTGFLIVYYTRLTGWNRMMVLFSAAVFALPGSLIGIGSIYFYNSFLKSFIYTTPLMPVITLYARFIPIAILVFHASFNQVKESLTEAAAMLTGNRRKQLFKIAIPLHYRSFLIASALIFVFAAGELAACVLVMPPGMTTLTVKIYNFLHYGSSDMVFGLSLLIMLLCFALTGSVIWSIKKLRRREI